MREEIKPTADFMLSEALDEMTEFETEAIKVKFGKPVEKMDFAEALCAFVWTFERRSDPQVSVDSIRHWKIRELRGYFVPEESVEGKAPELPDNMTTYS